MRYGYYIKAPHYDEGSCVMKLKLLDEDGTVKKYIFAEKVRVDGKRYDVEKIENSFTTRGLIRYALDKDEKISIIDFPSDYSASLKPKDNDSLIRFHSGVNAYYRSEGKAFVSYATLASAVIFNVPAAETDDDKKYSRVYVNDFMGNTRHTADIYDIDSYGNAGAAVLYDSPAADINYGNASYIVKKVTNTINSDNELGTELECWGRDGFVTFFVPEGVSLVKSGGNIVSTGDIIRVHKKNDEIDKIMIDIDMSGNTPVLNRGSTAKLDESAVTIAYQSGNVYSCSDNSICLSATVNNAMQTNPADMRFFYFAATVKLAKVNKELKTVTPIVKEDIHTAIGYGSKADFAVIRQTNDSTVLVFIFE